MISVKFYIERRKSTDGRLLKENRPLLLSVCYKGNRIKIYTGKKLHLQQLNVESQTVNDLHPEATFYNQYIDSIRKNIIKAYDICHAKNEIPDKNEFKIHIQHLLKTSISGFFESYLEFMENNCKTWTTNTYKKVKTLYNHLRKFQDTKDHVLGMESVNRELAVKLVEFFKEKKLKDITVKKNLDLLKWFMNWAAKNNRVLGDEYREIGFSPEKSSGEIPVYLHWEELLKLFNQPDLNKKESWACEIFSFMAFTGIRYSEIRNLKKSDVDETTIKINGYRSRTILQNKYSLNIFNRYKNKYYYNGTLFPVLSIITFHKHLRSAALKVGLKRQIQKRESLVKMNGSNWCDLKDTISAEMAINTYIANALKLEIPSPLILSNAKGYSSNRHLLISENIKNSAADQIKKFNILYDMV